jgi:hypothetical protein
MHFLKYGLLPGMLFQANLKNCYNECDLGEMILMNLEDLPDVILEVFGQLLQLVSFS